MTDGSERQTRRRTVASSHSESEDSSDGDDTGHVINQQNTQDHSNFDSLGTHRPRVIPGIWPPPRISTQSSLGQGPLHVLLNGQFLGRLRMDPTLDLIGLHENLTRHNGTQAVQLPATLIIDGGPPPLIYEPSPSPPPQKNTASRKRPAPTPSSDTTNKRKKTVAQGSRPIPVRGTEAYAKAMTVPAGMTKEEDETCLTCIRYNRRCKGTQLVVVKGTKRCQTCATPGTGTSSRICYYRDPARGIHTFEDAQRVLADTYGGRRLDQNTRAGRLERQGRAADAASQTDDDDDADTEEEDEEETEEE